MADKTLNEGKWLSKIKDVFGPKPKYTVELYCFLPFRWNDPVKVKIDDVSSLDDPRIEKAYKAIRAKHPKSPIRLYSPLGNKTFYENSSSEYELRAYDKDSDRVDTFGAGTLPQAMAMCEKMWNVNPDAYKTIEVIHNDEVVTNYNGLEEGFTMNLNAAPDPNNDENNKQNQDQQQEQPAQVDPDTSTVIKDKNGNDVTVSMSNDADTVSIDGQEINKDELNKAIDQVMKDFKNKEQNQQQEEPEQDQNSEEEQPAEDKENPENDKEEQDNQDNTEKDTAATDNAEQQQEEPESDETTNSQTENEEDYRLNKEENDYYRAKNKLGRKGEYALNKKLSDYDREVEKQNAEYNAQMDAERKEKQLAADREMKDFEVQQDREKRDADLEAEREKSLERKSYKDNGGQSFLNKMLNTNTAKHLAAAGLTGLTGGALAPMFAKGITDHGIDRINNYNKETERINKAKKDFDQKAEKNKKLDKAADERLKARRDLEDKQRNDNKSSAVAYKRQDAQRAIDQKQQRAALEKDITKKLANKYGYNKNYDIKRDIATAAKKREMMNAARKKSAEPVKTKAQTDNEKAKNTINKKNTSKSSKFAKNTMKGFKHESLNEAELQHSWVNQRNDKANIDEFIVLAQNGINPKLADVRRPKFFNTLVTKEADKYTEINGEQYRNRIVLDGVEEMKHPKTGEPVMVAIIKEKIPNSINPETGTVTYKDGNRFKITFNQFKRIIEDSENTEILQKFLKANPDDPELLLTLYQQAKNNMDEMYPSWENGYWDEYSLKNYNPVERTAIYLRWKELLKDTAYQTGHEMTADEVNTEFGIPKIQDNLNKLGSFGAKLDQKAIHNLLKQLPINKSDELLDQLQSALEDCYELNLNQTEKRIGDFMSTTPALLACENLINQMTKNSLENIENNVSDDKKDTFEDAKSALLNKYIIKVNIHGSMRKMVDPKIVSHKNEIEKYLDNLRKDLGITKWSMDIDDIKKHKEKPTLKSDEERLRDAGKTIDDYIKWSDAEKSYFVTYQDENGKPISDADTAKDIENYISKKADLNMDDRMFMLINKLDPEKTTPEELVQKRQDQANTLNSEIERLRDKYKHKFDLDKVKSQVNSYKPSLNSYLGQLESPFEKDRRRELSNDDPWINAVNSNVYYNKSDADNHIGILDRIDRSLARYGDTDSKGMPIANKYRELLDTLIEQWKKDYPKGNEKELGDVILSWYKDILKPDITKDTSVDKQLKNYIIGD